EVSTVSTTPTGGSTPGPVATEAASFESANAAFKQKRYDEASRMFATYTTNQPHDVWGYYMLGLSAWKTGDRDGAVDAFQRALVHAIEIDSTVAAFHNNLGLALERTGHITQATESYRAALGIDSTSQKASVNLTRVEGMKQDPAVVAVDLGAVAQAFVEQSKTWR